MKTLILIEANGPCEVTTRTAWQVNVGQKFFLSFRLSNLGFCWTIDDKWGGIMKLTKIPFTQNPAKWGFRFRFVLLHFSLFLVFVYTAAFDDNNELLLSRNLTNVTHCLNEKHLRTDIIVCSSTIERSAKRERSRICWHQIRNLLSLKDSKCQEIWLLWNISPCSTLSFSQYSEQLQRIWSSCFGVLIHA